MTPTPPVPPPLPRRKTDEEKYEKAKKKILDEEEEARARIQAQVQAQEEVSLIDPPLNTKLIERLVIGLSEVCLNEQCGYEKIKAFERPLTKEDFKISRWSSIKLKCPRCDRKCLVSPVLEPMEVALTRKYHIKSMKDTDELYYYDKERGVYHNGGEWLVRKACVEDDLTITTKVANDIKNRLVWMNYTDRAAFDPDIGWLSCKNMMVNLLTGEVRPNSPEHMTTVQIPHDYLVYPCMSRPSKIMAFLYQVMDYEAVETVLDFIAYCLWRGFPFHRWILFNGSGRNGKGVLTRLITALLGRVNVSSETLQRVIKNNFAPANLFGKMANIDADVSSEELKRTGILKMLTGGDDIAGEKKYRNAFYFTNYAKLIFSANIIPRTPDETDAFFARLIIINFPNQFLGDKANPNLLDELTTEDEMSKFLTMLIRRLPHVLQYGITDNSTIEQNYWRYMESSDPIRVFYEICIDRDSDKALAPGAYETKDDVYGAYVKRCEAKRLPKESSWNFSKRLKDYGLRSGQKKTERGRGVYVWKNIQLKDWKKVEDEDQETLD